VYELKNQSNRKEKSMARGGYRPGAGRPKGRTGKTKKTICPIGQKTEPTTAGAENQTPLSYMLSVMNDPRADKELRARMAIAAAPYIHTRAGEGKKQEKADRAKKAGAGKFAQGKAPLKRIK